MAQPELMQQDIGHLGFGLPVTAHLGNEEAAARLKGSVFDSARYLFAGPGDKGRHIAPAGRQTGGAVKTSRTTKDAIEAMP
jgi:hypothetical protein